MGAGGCGSRLSGHWLCCRRDHFLVFVSEKERSICDGNERHRVLSRFVFVNDYLLLSAPLNAAPGGVDH